MSVGSYVNWICTGFLDAGWQGNHALLLMIVSASTSRTVEDRSGSLIAGDLSLQPSGCVRTLYRPLSYSVRIASNVSGVDFRDWTRENRSYAFSKRVVRQQVSDHVPGASL